MQIPSLNRTVHAASLPLDKLATSTQITDREKIAEVSKQFEGVLLRQILGQAQKPMFRTNLEIGGGSSSALYQDIITQQLADRISHGGSFGFAKVLEKELAARYVKKEPSQPKPLNSPAPSTTPVSSRKEVEPSHGPGATSTKKISHPRPQPGK